MNKSLARGLRREKRVLRTEKYILDTHITLSMQSMSRLFRYLKRSSFLYNMVIGCNQWLLSVTKVQQGTHFQGLSSISSYYSLWQEPLLRDVILTN